MRSAGGIKLSGFFMKQLEKKYFPSYDEAQKWLESTDIENDGIIRKEKNISNKKETKNKKRKDP